MLYRKQLQPYDIVHTLGNLGNLVDGLWPEKGEDTSANWLPPVDICERADSIQFKVELPGIPRDEIEVEVSNGVLTVRGEKKMEEEKKGDTWHRREFSYGSFVRSFTLPSDMKSEEAEASFNEGLLTITIPKEEKALHRKIEIKG
ncbi:MAG: Hsp20/alpha crystallin family protein [Candidatus Fermentibacteraceae bacterium]|nr:Hsp20/alpha crystallin family protein [Candidatus Fermentibacteraceae bacterium]